MIIVKEYREENGLSRYAEWFDGSDAIAAAKVTVYVTRRVTAICPRLKGKRRYIQVQDRFRSGLASLFSEKDGATLIILLRDGTKNASRKISRLPKRLGKTINNGNERNLDMALSRDFKETIKARADRDAEFRQALLAEGVECFLAGDAATGKAVLRDYINATVGFQELGTSIGKRPKV